MPSVCVGGCGFEVDAGSLSLDWQAIGADASQTSGTGWAGKPDYPVEEWRDLVSIEHQYTNTSCRPKVAEVKGLIPKLRMIMGRGNIWNAVLKTSYSLTGDPGRPTPDGILDPLIRSNWHSSLPQDSYHDVSYSVHAMPELVRVEPGNTLRIRHVLWWRNSAYTESSHNWVQVPIVRGQYLAWPVAG